MAGINVTGPDGSTFSFPEGTSSDVITGAMRSHYNVQPQAPQPDQYQAAAQKDIADERAKGIPNQAGYARRALQGMTLGGADEIMAGLSTPLEMISHGTANPIEGYRYAKARENALMDEARKSQGILGDATELVGGVFTGGGLAKQGVTLTKNGMGLGARLLANAGEGAGYGAVSGALDGGDSLADRGAGALKGGAAGAAVGAAIPAVAAVASPLVSTARALINPQGVATSHLARAVSDAGMTPADVTQAVRGAANAGQDVYTVADALGNSGQRMLSTVTRAPGAGRQQAVEFLENRQAGQSRRVANALAEGLQAPDTAAQREASLTAQRSASAEKNYGAARDSASPVDVSPAIEAADNYLTPGVNRVVSQGSDIADNSIRKTVERAKSFLTDGKSNVSDFNESFQAKQEIDNLIDTGSKSQQKALIPIKQALDDALATASPDYAGARNTFSRQSKAIESVDAGKTAAARGRMSDTIPAFRSMPPDQQASYRVGYADRLIGNAEGGAPGVNKARPLLADDVQAELHAMSPLSRGNPMMQRISRENQMFETRRQAIGGSQTADNLADADAMKIDPSVIGALLTGHPISAAGHVMRAGMNNLSGNTPAVREHLARLLLTRGGSADISPAIQSVFDGQAKRAAIANALLSGTRVGAGEAPGMIGQRK